MDNPLKGIRCLNHSRSHGHSPPSFFPASPVIRQFRPVDQVVQERTRQDAACASSDTGLRTPFHITLQSGTAGLVGRPEYAAGFSWRACIRCVPPTYLSPYTLASPPIFRPGRLQLGLLVAPGKGARGAGLHAGGEHVV